MTPALLSFAAEPSEVKEVKKTEDKKEDNENEDVVEVKEDPKSMYAGLPKSLLTCQVCNKSAWNGMVRWTQNFNTKFGS